MTDDEKLGGIGASDVGKLFTKEGVKSKTAQSLAFDKAKELINGYISQKFENQYTIHGKDSEFKAFNEIVQPLFPDAVFRSDVSIRIDEGIWATPDAIAEEVDFDIKCPYSITTYFDNITKPKQGYLYQKQMQMIATRKTKGYLVYYLTSNDPFGQEYEIDINERHKFVSVDAQEDIQAEIIWRIGEFFKVRDELKSHLDGASLVSDKEYFNLALSGRKITPLKDKSNLLAWKGKILKNNHDYLVLEK